MQALRSLSVCSRQQVGGTCIERVELPEVQLEWLGRSALRPSQLALIDPGATASVACDASAVARVRELTTRGGKLTRSLAMVRLAAVSRRAAST
jgi:hypothetical protein